MLSIPITSWTCSCPPLSPNLVDKLFEEAELVFVGSPIENVHYNVSIKQEWDDSGFGTEVKFKVTKVLKGQLDSEYVFINQIETDNCFLTFEFGDSYVIVGRRILNFQTMNPFSAYDFSHNELPSPPSPSILGVTIENYLCHNVEMEAIDFWNNIAEKEAVIYTNQCWAFESESNYGKLLLGR